MSMSDEVELLLDGHVIARIDSSMQPMHADLISIRGKTYRVRSRNYALDNADDWAVARMRLAVNLEQVP